MKISVAMATYNGGKHLQEQLESFVIQSHLPDELVVCDDGSSDETLDILDRFGKDAPFPVHVHRNPENLGYAQNFAKAVGFCQGDIIFFSDQDDVWFREKIARMLEAFSGNLGAGYVFSDAKLVDENLLPFGRLWDHIGFSGSRYENYVNGNQMEVILGGGPFIYGNSMAFRSCFRSLILPIMSTSEFTHDSWISLLLSAVGNRGIPVPVELLAYRQHAGQVVGAGRKKTSEEKWNHMKQEQTRYFFEKAAALRSLKDRVNVMSGIDINPVDQCILHFDVRASLYSMSEWRKIFAVFAEMNSGRYSRFSSSWRSILKDLFLVGDTRVQESRKLLR